MAATDSSGPAPRYRPSATDTRTRRVVAALGALGLTALATADWLHSTSLMLRCEEGTLRAYRPGFLPWEQVPLDDPALPPLAVAPHLCQDIVVDSPKTLVDAYAAIVTRDVDHALASQDGGELGIAERALDTLAGLHTSEDPQVTARRRSLVVAQLRADLAAARAARLHALQRLRRARELGVKPALLIAFERELAQLDEKAAQPRSSPPPRSDTPSAASHPEEEAPPGRSL